MIYVLLFTTSNMESLKIGEITSNDPRMQHPSGGDANVAWDQFHGFKYLRGVTWDLGMPNPPMWW